MKRDNRPVMEQVKSGFKIAGGILSSFAAFVLFGVSYIDIMHPENKHLAVGWMLLVATALTMFASVQVWARWFCAIVSYAAVRCTMFIIPALMGFSRVPLQYVVATAAALCFLAFCGIRLYDRRRFSTLDRLCVTIAAMLLFIGIITNSTGNYAGLLSFVAAGLLLIPSAYHEWFTRRFPAAGIQAPHVQ